MTWKTSDFSLVFFLFLFGLGLFFWSRIWDRLLVFLDLCHLPCHQPLVSITDAQVLPSCALIPSLCNESFLPFYTQGIMEMAQA